MKLKHFRLLAAPLGLAAWLASCGNPSPSPSTPPGQTHVSPEDQALGLMQEKCFTCHDPNLEAETRLAPPMFMVRNHYYYDSTITRDTFVAQVQRFVLDPSEDKSVMPGARNNFGLMPKQNFNPEDVKLIAGYIYDNDLESDAWYAKWDAFRKRPKK